MRVAIVSPWPLTTTGGTQTLLRRAGAELLRRGFIVRALTGERGVDTESSPVPEERLPVVPVPASRPRVGASTLGGLRDALARFDPDVVLYAPHHSTEAVDTAAAARALGVPFAYWPLVHFDHSSHVGREARAFARSADLVLCVTERERRWLADEARVAAPVLVGAGSDLAAEPLAPPRSGPRRALVSVGAFERHKRLEEQLEALALSPAETTLTIAGRGEGEGRLQERIARLGLEGRARLAVGLPDEALRTLVRESDAFLFTSRSESFGLALLDAICLGTLPVVYPNACCADLVAASGFGLVAEKETPRSLAEAIGRARDVPRAVAPDAAFRRAHAWSAVGDRLARALEGLAACRAARSGGADPASRRGETAGGPAWNRREPSMPERSRTNRALDALVLVAAFAFAALYARATAARIGPTFDETTYVAEGLRVFRTGSHAGLMKLGTMPLPVDVATFPLALAERIAGAPLDPRADLDVLLPLARAGALPFLALLLGAGMSLGRRAGGPAGGRLAALLLASEPALLAHGSLATTDVAVSALLLWELETFLAGRGARWPRRIALPGLWAAAALLAKASSVAFGPLLLLAAELHRLRGEGRLPSLRSSREALRPFARDLARIALVALLGTLLWCGSDFRPQKSFLAWARAQDGPAAPAVRFVAENLRVFPNAFEGIVRQLKHNVLGHGVYLLGSTHRRALPWYFPVALALKLSTGLLLALAALLVVRPRALASAAGAGALALLALTFAYRVQIGIRLVLPLVALLVVAVAAAVVVTARDARRRVRHLGLALAALVPLSSLAASLRVLPDALCYANPLAGGTDHGHLALSDSNHDWGQGLPALRRACAERGLASIDVWYFGSDPAVERLPFRRVALHDPPRRDLVEISGLLSSDFLAAGTTLMYGAYVREPLPPWLLELRSREPAFRTRTFLVYDLSAERRRARNAESPQAASAAPTIDQ